MDIVGYTLLALAALVCIVVGFGYNRLVRLRQYCRQAFSDVDAQLQQRADLLPNLVETVRGYATHERETLDAVIRARNAAKDASTPAQAAAAEALVGASLGRMFALSEAYPDLKANSSFVQLQGELADLENKIAAARRFLNSAVAEYNAALEQIPAVAYARALGLAQEQMFVVNADARAAVVSPPQVRF